MKYISTRNKSLELDFEDTLLSGMSSDGGLYIPSEWPQLEKELINRLKDQHYSHFAASILQKFCQDILSAEDIADIVHKTYNSHNFTHPDVAPLVQIADDFFILELFHGPTFAFKDYALQLLGRLFDYTLSKKDQKITIVGATSGDTGSAAIEACRHSRYINIFILHPKGRTSEIQRKQMTTVNSPNVKNIAVDGTFDDCQAIVKDMFRDESFRSHVNLSAVNSINWARICAQIVYYAVTSLRLGGPDKTVNFSVPTGNFGNVYAAHCARKMGVAINDLIIATNKNDIITRFFEHGEMIKRDVSQTLSPSMDIQVSSNFERYLFELVGHDPESLTGLMKEFQQTGKMQVDSAHIAKAQNDFKAFRCDDNTTLQTISDTYKESGYILDPHSAIGVNAAKQAKTEGPVVSLACAHPAKFPDAVKQAIGKEPEMPERLKEIMELPEFIIPLAADAEKIKSYVKANI